MHPIYVIVDRYHVGTPIEDLLADLRARVSRARANGSQISKREEKALLRAARGRHRANRKLYSIVMRGL